MYRRQTSNSGLLLRLIIIGLIVGIGFYVYDQRQHQPAAPLPTVVPLIQPTQQATFAPPAGTSPALLSEATLFIPTAGIYSSVIETYLQPGGDWEISHLGNNVGHLEGTGWFDSPSNVVMVGHVELADGRAGIFKPINSLKIGDLVIVYQNQVERDYAVRAVRTVEPDDLSVLYPTTTPTLTLITCGDYDLLQNVYHTRVVVIATAANA